MRGILILTTLIALSCSSGGLPPVDAGSDGGGGVSCGAIVCGPGQQCCSASCSLCGSMGGACPAIACIVDGGVGPDAGMTPDGGPIGTPCGDAGTCTGNDLCFVVSGCGGAAGRPCSVTSSCQTAPSCSPLTCACLEDAGSNDPCAHSQSCDVDGGTVACQFDYP